MCEGLLIKGYPSACHGVFHFSFVEYATVSNPREIDFQTKLELWEHIYLG